MLSNSLLFFLCLLPFFISQTFLQILPENLSSNDFRDDPLYCESWRLSVETNNAGYWKEIPSQCENAMDAYINGPQYELDSKVVACHADSFAKSINISDDRKDAWIFDVDETLISKYIANGSKINASDLGSHSPRVALPWSLWLYNRLLGMGFEIVLLTGRKEKSRSSTNQTLLSTGYHSWTKLILRESADKGKAAVVYKSERRAALQAQGYRIHGSCGDQWSDLLGAPMAKRSFKVPNPMYYIE